SSRPTASTVNFDAGKTVPNMVIAKVGRGGGVSVLASTRGAHVVVDVLGYLPGVSTAGTPTTWTSIMRDFVDMPINYDRCYPIGYQINPSGAPSGWAADIKTAFGMISAATGLVFVDLGTTTEAPTPGRTSFDANDNLKPILVAFTTESVIPDLAGSVVGVAGSNAFGGFDSTGTFYLPPQFITGDAYFDRDAAIPSGFGAGQFGVLALHELGHVVGLGHVDNLDEIMNPFLISRAAYYGTGDLDGLGILYKTQSCPQSPATYLPAIWVTDAGVGASMLTKLAGSGVDVADLNVDRRVIVD
ncbi:MAG: matrixin family metalloprotease, partial [Microthrixaceae bacterium]